MIYKNYLIIKIIAIIVSKIMFDFYSLHYNYWNLIVCTNFCWLYKFFMLDVCVGAQFCIIINF